MLFETPRPFARSSCIFHIETDKVIIVDGFLLLSRWFGIYGLGRFDFEIDVSR